MSKLEINIIIGLFLFGGFYFYNSKSEAEIDCNIENGTFVKPDYCSTITEAECKEYGGSWVNTEQLCYDKHGDVLLGVGKVKLSKWLKG